MLLQYDLKAKTGSLCLRACDGRGNVRNIDVGRTTYLVPKEQPPRKLSGQRTDVDTKLWRVARIIVPAEGIAISGALTLAQGQRGHHMRGLWLSYCRDAAGISIFPSANIKEAADVRTFAHSTP
jgi:hypothetical protein